MTTALDDNGVTFADGNFQKYPSVPVQQTVLSGPVDTNGLPSFGGSTGSTTVTATGTLVATAANGVTNRTGSITNPQWTGITANSFATLTVNADGSCTPNVRTLAPVYQWGGTPSVTNGQLTFNISEMKMYLGNGASATQVYEVVVGEFTASGTVSAITWYALRGRYQAAWVATLPAAGVAVSFNHNIGVADFIPRTELRCTTAEFGYAIGDIVTEFNGNVGGYPAPITCWRTYKTMGFTVSSTAGLLALNKTTGANAALTLANWAYRVTGYRPWG